MTPRAPSRLPERPRRCSPWRAARRRTCASRRTARSCMYSRSNGVEVFDMATHTTAAVAHTGASDATPVWSPDGTQIAFRRTVSGQPWALWVADAATLTPRQVWQASAGLGSSYYSLDQNPTFESQPGDQFLWSDDGTLAFVWEVDGWRHLYSVPAAGGAPATLLTPGDGEVETAEVARDHKSIVYATNIGEIGRRHLFSVGFHGGAPSGDHRRPSEPVGADAAGRRRARLRRGQLQRSADGLPARRRGDHRPRAARTCRRPTRATSSSSRRSSRSRPRSTTRPSPGSCSCRSTRRAAG